MVKGEIRIDFNKAGLLMAAPMCVTIWKYTSEVVAKDKDEKSSMRLMVL